jgi:hypothetical protein
MSAEDLYNDIAGNFNYLDGLEGFVRGLFYGDMGYRFVIQRRAKGGGHSLDDCRAMLKERGVATFWYGFDSQKMYFRVKNRQARFAEYILLRAGVELLNPAFDSRNAAWANQSKHEGKPVKSWRQSAMERKAEKRSQSASWLEKLLG